ncbi:DDE superfamily endonuclease [Popillia japonica]|uniref:DDE superfamily endonuclease n=1 Tax=Popillia japonica TaxID=7064 RepID=A0AAW1IGA6_POPJA
MDLAQPLVANEENEREPVPRNNDYFEITIPQYMGDLFIEHFRMSRGAFEQLTNVIQNTGLLAASFIPLEKKILFSLWVLAKPESFLAAGDRFGLAKSTAHVVFKEIIGVLVALIPHYIVWPNDHAEIVRVFYERSNGFPGIVGAVDGCHIPIKQPTQNPNDFYNRKHFHSIILQGICDHRMVFMDIYVGALGRVQSFSKQ